MLLRRGFGCIDHTDNHVESPAEVVARVEAAMEHVSEDSEPLNLSPASSSDCARFPAQIPMERISLHPDCGFSPSVQNPMDLDEAGAKLGAMCEAAKLLREKYGAGSSL